MHLVVKDVRLRNKAEALKRLGAILIRLEGQELGAVGGIPGYISEIKLDRWVGWDWIFENNAPPEELFRKIDELIRTY